MKQKFSKLLIFCILSSIIFNAKAMEEKTENLEENETITTLNKHIENHEYGAIRNILYAQLEKDKSGKLFNWIRDRAKSHALPFFWYMIARDFYYKITTHNLLNIKVNYFLKKHKKYAN